MVSFSIKLFRVHPGYPYIPGYHLSARIENIKNLSNTNDISSKKKISNFFLEISTFFLEIEMSFALDNFFNILFYRYIGANKILSIIGFTGTLARIRSYPLLFLPVHWRE